MMGGGSKQSSNTFIQLLKSKQKFLFLVLTLLLAELAVTGVVAAKVRRDIITSKKKSSMSTLFFWSLIVVQFIIICLLATVHTSMIVKTLLFTILSASLGYVLGYSEQHADIGVITSAIVSTAALTLILIIFGAGLIYGGINLGNTFGKILFLGLLILITYYIVGVFVASTSTYYKVASLFGIFLFQLFIVYDTNRILQRNYNGDFVSAALDYYLDILNLFVNEQAWSS